MNARTTLMTISLALSILIGLALSRQNTASRESSELTIGLSMDTLKEERWQGDRNRLEKKCEELGAKVVVESANSDDATQLQQVKALISRGVKALVIVPHDGKAMKTAVEEAHKAGIPVIAYDRLINDCDLDLYLSFDNVSVGKLQAQYLVDHLPTKGKGKIVRIYGAPTDNNAKLFKEGQDLVLQPLIDRGDIVVVHQDWAEDWKPENGKKIANAAITKFNGQFDAVLASNDGTASGAIQALTEAGLAGKILVTGQDAELAACQRIVGGTQTMTIYKPLQTLANGAAELAVKLAKREAIVANDTIANGKIDVPAKLYKVIAVDKDNMVETVVKDGFQAFDQVYRGIPEEQRPKRP